MSLFGIDKVDKTQDGWRDKYRSDTFNWLCKAGNQVGKFFAKAGPIAYEMSKEALKLAADIMLPDALQRTADLIVGFGPRGILLAQALMKKADELNVPGAEKMLSVIGDMTDWLEAEGKDLTKTDIITYLQDLFYDMRKDGSI